MVATVELLFDKSTLDPDPLSPLSKEIADEKLGSFTIDPHLYNDHPGLTMFVYLRRSIYLIQGSCYEAI